MKKTISVIAVLMIFLLIMGSAAAADVDVHLTGSHVSGDRGANVTVTLSLDEPTVLYSGLADLKYDESVLDLVEAGFVLSGTPEINRFDPDDKFPEEGVDGTGTFAMNTPTEQSGVLFTATFTIKSTAAVSETEVEIVPVPLKKSTTEVLTVGYTKCKITITSSTPHTCSFTVENKDAVGALVSAGTCKTEAVYRYSCACGALEENYGTHTFKGDKDPQNHTGGTELVGYLAPNHATQTDGYTGDTKCLGCGEPIASGQTITVTPHAESATWAKDDTHHWHTCTVEGCTYTYEKLAHRGGTATCKDKAACEDCGQTYGELSTTHDFDTEWSKDENGHWHACKVCGAMQEAAKIAHIPNREAPTETDAVKCTACDYIIVKALGHVCAFDREIQNAQYLKQKGTCVKPSVYYKSCECGEKSDTLTFNGDVDSTVHERSNTSGYRAPNHVKQTSGETGVTTCADCGVVLKPNQKIAPSVHRSEKTYAHNSDEHWKTCEYTGCDAEVLNTRAAHTYGKDGVCTVCGYKKAETPAAPIRGDFNGDGKVDSDDAIYLLKNIFFGKDYPLNQGGDLNGDGKVDSDDAIYLSSMYSSVTITRSAKIKSVCRPAFCGAVSFWGVI